MCKDKVFTRTAKRNSKYVTQLFSDKAISSYSSVSASGALNKWLKSRVPEGCVIHSFLHSLKGRLGAEECPPDIAGAIGGWCSTGVGQKYGSGHKLSSKLKYLVQII